MAGRFVKIDIPVETDLGELIPGQHIVLEGITLRTPWGSALRSTFVPGFPKSNRRLNTSWGLGDVADDLGTACDHGGEGGWDPDADGIVRRGDEHLGNGIPSAASWLTIAFIPAHGWDVPGRWITKIMVDLTLNKIVGVCDWAGR
jgi:hypothetical protein